MEEIKIDRYDPDYDNPCGNCGVVPTVLGLNKNGEIIYDSEVCGPCFFGEDETIDPETWND